MNLQAGFMESFQEEFFLNLDAMRYFPGEVVETFDRGGTSLGNFYDAAKQEIEWDIAALQMLPGETGETLRRIVAPPVQAAVPALTPLAWIAMAALGIYALTLASPAIKKALK